MKKNDSQHLNYILGCFLLGFMVIGALTLFSAGLKIKAKHDTNNRMDSLTVVNLHKEAYLCRLEDPRRTLFLEDEALRIAKRIKYKHGIADAYRIRGMGFSSLNNDSLAELNYLNALRYYQELNDKKSAAGIYNNMGNLHKSGDLTKALHFFNRSLCISEELNDQNLLAVIYYNLAVIYLRTAEFNKSLYFFEKSQDVFRQRNDTTSLLRALRGVGMAHLRLNNVREAKIVLLKTMDEAKRYKIYSVLADCYLTLSQLYIQQGQFDLAERSITRGISYSIRLKDRKRYNYFIHESVQLGRKNGDFEKALSHLTVIYKYDSTLLNKFQTENKGITSRHILQQLKIQESELLIARQKYREARFIYLIVLIIIVFLISALIIIVIYFIKEKRRRTRELVIQNDITELKQRALQAMMNPHFVFNVMNSIQHFLNMSDSATANRILVRFARLARKHLEICMKSKITLQEEIIYLRFYLSLEKIRFINKMDFSITVSNDVDTDDILIPSMLIQPFIENAIWHGLMPKEENGYIHINFSLAEEELIVSIIDNGIGLLNSEKLKKQTYISRGISLIKERVSLLNKLNGRSIFIFQQQTGNAGTEVLIRIPA